MIKNQIQDNNIVEGNIDEKKEAEKARKDGDLDNDYYSSPMAKKKVDFTIRFHIIIFKKKKD